MFSQLFDEFQLKVIWKDPGRAVWLYQHIPSAVLDWLRLANLRKTVNWVNERSIFYSNRFRESGLDLRHLSAPSGLGGFFTLPADLQSRPADHFLCEKAQTAFETTGTTSRRSKRVFFSNREIEDAGRVGAAGFWNLGLRPTDRIASSFDYSFWVSGPTLKAASSAMGAFHIEAGRIDP
ncbi:MAG: hypothetical protein HQL11_06010, partial [Candidatus Omnitrophica bacterium]|nr:hypothetical protein [Candidatus Omnitrophota bacterium]